MLDRCFQAFFFSHFAEEAKKSEHPFMVKFPRHVAAETEDPKVMLKALEDAESAAKNSGPMTEADHEVSVTPRAPGGGGRMPAWVDTIHPREAYNQTVDAIIRNRYADEEVLRRVIGKGNKVSILDDIERQLKWGGYKNVSNSRVHELLRAPFQDKAQLG